MNEWFNKNIPPEVADVICKIKLSVNDGEDKKQLTFSEVISSLNIDYESLEKQLEEMPGMFAYWCFISAEAEAQVALLERTVKYKRGLLQEAIIDKFNEKSDSIKNSDRTPPQWQIKEMIEADKDINEAEIRYIIAKKNQSKIKAIVEGYRMKSEHLRSLAGFKRQERRETNN